MPRAFSLIELVIVVVIIGIIAAIAVPRMSSAQQSSRSASLHASMSNLERAFLQYHAEHQEFPEFIAQGTYPAELADFVSKKVWLSPSPVGGAWMWAAEPKFSGADRGISLVDVANIDQVWQDLEARFDDNEKSTGTYVYDGSRIWRPLP